MSTNQNNTLCFSDHSSTLNPKLNEHNSMRNGLFVTQGLGDFSVHSVELDMEGICILQQSHRTRKEV